MTFRHRAACLIACIPGVAGLALALPADSTRVAPWAARATRTTLASAPDPQAIVRQHAFGGSGRDDAYDLWPFRDGFVVTGSTENPASGDVDLVVLRVDAGGDLVWARTYGGANLDIGFAVRTVDDDRIAVAGWTRSFGAGAGDFYVLGLDADGELRFARTFGGAGEERATALAVTDAGLLVLGESYSHGAGDSRFYAVATDPNGNVQWERTYDGGPLNERALAVVDVEDGWVLVGNSMDTTSGSTATVSDGYVVGIARDGTERWNRTIGGEAHDILHHAVRLLDGRILASGYTRGYGARGTNDVWLVTLGAGGEPIASRVVGGDGEDHNIVARLGPDGRTWLGGYGRQRASGDWNVQVVELEPGGAPIGLFHAGGPGDDGAASLWPLGGRRVMIAGHTTRPNGTDRDILLLELRP